MANVLAAVSLLAVLLTAPAQASAAATGATSGARGTVSVLYVSPTGDDGATGTKTDPLQTPQVAVDRVADGGTVYLLPGTYHQQRIVVRRRHGLTIAATQARAAVLDATGPAWRRS